MALKLESVMGSHLRNRNDHHTRSALRNYSFTAPIDSKGHSQRRASKGQKCSQHPNVVDTVPKHS